MDIANDRSKRTNVKFDQPAEGDKVQFNKRVTRSTADGFEILSIKTRKKIPDLLAEGLEMLEAKYGKVGSSGKWGGGDVVGTFRIPNLLPVRLSI